MNPVRTARILLPLLMAIFALSPAFAQQSAGTSSIPQIDIGKGIQDGLMMFVRTCWPYILLLLALTIVRGVVDAKARRRRIQRARQRKRQDADYLALRIAEEMRQGSGSGRSTNPTKREQPVTPPR